jgi:hypothetical protein
MEESSSGSGSSLATSRTAASFASMPRSSMAAGRHGRRRQQPARRRPRAASQVASESGVVAVGEGCSGDGRRDREEVW